MVHYFFILLILFYTPLATFAELIEDSWLKNKVYIEESPLNKELEYKNDVKSGLSNKNIALNVKQRASKFKFEKFNLNPHSYFMYNDGDYQIIGRKYISDLVIEKKLPGLFCSQIKADMILGKFEKNRISETGILIEYKPFTYQEKIKSFAKLIKNKKIDIWYPYTQLLGDNKQEKSTPKEGWIIDKERAKFLGIGEKEIRSFTINMLKKLFAKQNLKGFKIYDPACSTGEFLANIKKHFPYAITIGQELSKAMVNYAKPNLDLVYHGDAIKPKIKEASADIVFFRFLNSEVVTSQRAYDIFNAVAKTIKPGGVFVIFGHTPVLIDTNWLESQGYEIIQKNGHTEDKLGVFQYIVAIKPQNNNIKEFINPIK